MSEECKVQNVRPGFEICDCPNMKEIEGDTDMEIERYECQTCGKRDRLHYDEMK